MKRFICLAVILSLCTLCAAAQAAYPDKPIKIITSSAPGGMIDNTTRLLANMLAEELGVSVVVANHPGTGGNVGTNMLLAARPDGYTLMTGATAPFNDNFFTMQVRYKYDDLAPISLISGIRYGVISPANAPWNTLREACQYAKKEGRPLKAAIMELRAREVLEYVAAQEGAQLAPVPQTGGANVLTAVMGGHADVGILGSIFTESAKAGKVKALASASSERMSHLPDMTTLKEQGYDIAVDSGVIFYASSKVPDAIIQMLSDTIIKLSQSPKFQEQLVVNMNTEPIAVGRDYAKVYLKDMYNDMARSKGQPPLP